MNRAANNQNGWRQVLYDGKRIYVEEVTEWEPKGGTAAPRVPKHVRVVNLVSPLCTDSDVELMVSAMTRIAHSA